MVDQALSNHVETKIFPIYAKCDPGHRIPHVKHVMRRAFAFAESVPGIDDDVLFTAVAYHDVGCSVDRERHETVSAEMLRADGTARAILGDERLELAAQAVEDHRASSGTVPRNDYGRILSSADRNTDLDSALPRAWQFRLGQLGSKGLDFVVRDAYEHIKSKYGPGGYATSAMYFDDPEYAAMLAKAAEITMDVDSFRGPFLRAAGQTI